MGLLKIIIYIKIYLSLNNQYLLQKNNNLNN
jgi:hypothetical protein